MEITPTLERPRIPEFRLNHRLQVSLEQTDIEVPAMAHLLGVSKSTVYHWLTGRSAPKLGMVKQWALICQVPWTWLQTGIEPEGDGGTPATGDVIHRHRGGNRQGNPVFLKRVA